MNVDDLLGILLITSLTILGTVIVNTEAHERVGLKVAKSLGRNVFY